MTTSIVSTLGIISEVVGLVSFGMDLLPEQESVASKIRIAVGLDMKDGLTNGGGDLPDVRLFNEAGDFIGMSADPGTVRSGEYGDITVQHNSGSKQQATYALFSANDDAICIVYAGITWPSGERYGWMGDWGRACGGTWYYSNIYVSETAEKPDCVWIDANNDQPQTGFQVHWPEFVGQADSIPEGDEAKKIRTDWMCTAGPVFKMYKYPDTDPNSITYWVPLNGRSLSERRDLATATSYGPSKNPVSARFQPRQHHAGTRPANSTAFGMNLVIGDDDRHSAKDLCGSETSFGPDFVNIKSKTFCRMSDKTFWPMCDTAKNTDNCFNIDLKQLIINGVAARDEPYPRIYDLPVILSSDNPPSDGCPSLGVTLGSCEDVDQLRPNLTVLICTQRLQLVEVNTAYPANSSSWSAPDLTADVYLNLVPLRNAIDVQSGSSSLSTLISGTFWPLYEVGQVSVGNDTRVDPFFKHILYGSKAYDAENLFGSENADRLISAMNDLYQRFMVHVIDLEWRPSMESGSATQPIPQGGVVKGTVTATVPRLKLSKTSKIIL
ncbi:hypothetical protein NUW58_g915 [Xylaria curta]|uniref:Uncharacterized protein n=1 Tax=Xylaria curta TaxID=42375 RepID=A0ACC1PQ76_9PEZI|nr:hypothetical protein NUW58_g915 [Xylaria curta]